MGIHYVEKTFAMSAPSGLGAEPRPELIGPLLSGLHATLVDSVRMGFLHASRLRGRIPRGLEAAADVRFLGLEGVGDTETKLHFRVASFGDVAAELFEQRQLWDDGPKPEQNAFDLLALSLGDVRSERSDSSRYDQGLLNRFAKFGRTLNLGVESIRIEGAPLEQAQIDQQLVHATNELRKLTPPSRRVRLSAKLDMLGVSRKVMGLYLEDGSLVTALWNADDFAGLANFLDKEVTIEGQAVFRPSGKLLRIDADAISPATAGDAYFSTMPLPGVVDYAALARTRPGVYPYKELFGMIPGDESDEEFLKLIESMS
jgi:hypothetical protein